MTVLDASAVLALVHDEPGADIVAAGIASATLGTANLAEVIGKLVEPESTSDESANCLPPPASPSNRFPRPMPSWPGRCAPSTVGARCRLETAAAWRSQFAVRQPKS